MYSGADEASKYRCSRPKSGGCPGYSLAWFSKKLKVRGILAATARGSPARTNP